ncbi:hypothetical protein ONZ45_g6196 [Pleurotus djamor]|nr:hypothetical protein ONZ45_g6196 [Pleurotus djamor]
MSPQCRVCYEDIGVALSLPCGEVSLALVGVNDSHAKISGHVFCRGCVNRIVRLADEDEEEPRCPTCRQPYEPDDETYPALRRTYLPEESTSEESQTTDLQAIEDSLESLEARVEASEGALNNHRSVIHQQGEAINRLLGDPSRVHWDLHQRELRIQSLEQQTIAIEERARQAMNILAGWRDLRDEQDAHIEAQKNINESNDDRIVHHEVALADLSARQNELAQSVSVLRSSEAEQYERYQYHRGLLSGKLDMLRASSKKSLYFDLLLLFLNFVLFRHLQAPGQHPSHNQHTTHEHCISKLSSSSTHPPKASDNDCAICHEPLLVPSNDDEKPSLLIDDVALRCKHHFHWSCILEYALSSPEARNRCALCRQSVLNARGQFIVEVRNEGGFTGGFDFGQEIDEQLYYKENPEAEREMTFLSLMAQGDLDDAEKFLKGEDPGATKKMDPNVCYESGGMTAMHMAALNDDVEGVQLLLRYGADKEQKSEDGHTALDLAEDVDAKRVTSLLKG